MVKTNWVLKGVGTSTAKNIVAENTGFIDLLQENPNAPDGYKEELEKVQAIFLHQTVIDPSNSMTVPLNQWEANYDNGKKEMFQRTCGLYLFFSLI